MGLKIENISKKYGRKTVLDGIGLSCDYGCCIGILGANGCGKSTLLSILSGVQKADSGKMLLDGTDLLKNPKLLQSSVGYVPQGTPLLDELTAYDNLLLWYPRDVLRSELEGGVLSMLGINGFLKVPVRKMSGGMKKRLSIGCAVAKRPPVLLADEPTAALDLVCKEEISNYFAEYKRNGGIILLATHDVRELSLCDRLFILKDGRLSPFEYDGNTQRLVNSL